jgi:hypothetical protein
MTLFRSSRLALAPLFVALTPAFGACGGSEFTTAPTTGDDGGLDVNAPDVLMGADSPMPSEAGGDAGEAGVIGNGTIVYVSTSGGLDSNSGLTPSSAKKTIAAGLLVAAGIPASEVHVCTGAYPESQLIISRNAKLMGGYDCTTWKRSATYGAPGFDKIHETTIQNGDVPAQPTTLVLAGKLTQATLIDGFTIRGASSATAPVGAIAVRDGASPVISNDWIEGGSGQGTAVLPGSYGIDIEGMAAPTINEDEIIGGGGMGNSGSIGVIANTGGAATIQGDVIYGGHGVGSGAGAVGTAGLVIAATLSIPVAGCAIYATDATAGAAYAYSSWGVIIGPLPSANVSAVVQSSLIEGGTGATGIGSVGVAIATTGDVGLVGDRIYGGKRGPSASTIGGQTLGVWIAGAGSALIADSMIHAGSPYGPGGTAYGVLVGTTARPAVLAYDTIYTGNVAATAAAAYFSTSTFGTQLKDDLLVMGSFSDVGLKLQSCSTPGAISVLDNVMFTNGPPMQCTAGAGPITYPTVATLASFFGFGVVASTGSLGGATCTDTGCIPYAPCPGPACLQSLFPGFSTDDGVTTLTSSQTAPDGGVGASGWMLSPTIPCALAREGVPIVTLGVDINGTPRASKPTVGAQEVTACQ